VLLLVPAVLLVVEVGDALDVELVLEGSKPSAFNISATEGGVTLPGWMSSDLMQRISTWTSWLEKLEALLVVSG
jgi:hypothetical protein